MEAYNKDDFATAYREFMESAEEGDRLGKHHFLDSRNSIIANFYQSILPLPYLAL